MSIAYWTRAISVFSLMFQGYSVCYGVEAVLYAVVSFSVLFIQLAVFISSKPSPCPTFDLHKTVFTAALTTLSVMLNFGDRDSQVSGNVVTTIGIVLDAIDFGMNLEHKEYAAACGYKQQSVDNTVEISPTIGKGKKSKKKKGSVKSD